MFEWGNPLQLQFHFLALALSTRIAFWVILSCVLSHTRNPDKPRLGIRHILEERASVLDHSVYVFAPDCTA